CARLLYGNYGEDAMDYW
nr:immunoglobulin heavy chain junction region [Mus musculus]